MPQPIKTTATEKRMNAIIRELQSLTIWTQELAKELHSLPEPPKQAKQKTLPFTIGDFVRITNSY